MTSKARFTQAELVNAIRGAIRAGLDVAGVTIKPDGTIIVFDARGQQLSDPNAWSDLDDPKAEDWRQASHFYRKKAVAEGGEVRLDDTPFSCATLSDRWQCSPELVRKLIREGNLAGFRHGRDLRVTAAEVVRFESTGGTAAVNSAAATQEAKAPSKPRVNADQPQFPSGAERDLIGMLERPYEPRELARRWRCKTLLIRTLIREGKIAAIKHGLDFRISPKEVARIERRGSL